jgi:hypothetical protein
MATDQQAPASRKRRIGRSVEVQHGRRGVVLMLRRGLHGAKNWVLEPDGDGLPRSPWTKFLRVLVILAPLWIVLSAATGGPERGGHQVGLGQAILSALIVTLVGLGFLSARERRLGREEPWAELPDIDTSGDDAESTTLVDPAPENPTEVLENAQVSEAGPDGEVVTPGDIPDESDHTSQISPETATQVVTAPLAETSPEEVSESPFVQVNEGDQQVAEPSGNPVTPVDTWAETPVINHHNSDPFEGDNPTVPLVPAKTGGHPVTVSLEKAVKPQVIPGDQVDTAPLGGGVEPVESFITESDEDSGVKDSGGSVTLVGTRPVQEVLFPQVNAGDRVVTEVVTPQMALPGPYEVADDPMAEDWWLVKPDQTAPESEEVEPVEAPEVQPPVVEEAAPVEIAPGSGLDPAVVLYRALRTMPNATEDEKAAARDGAAEWARREIRARRQSQRSAAEILGVSKTTVANWVGHDPWEAVDVG